MTAPTKVTVTPGAWEKLHVAPAAIHPHDHLVAIHDHGVDTLYPNCPDIIGRYHGHVGHVDIALTGQAWCIVAADADVEVLRRIRDTDVPGRAWSQHLPEDGA